MFDRGIKRACAMLIAALGMATAAAHGDDWPQFRGPGGAGVAPASSRPPTKWNSKTNIAWKTPLPGPGSSSPVTFGKYAYVTCYSGYGLNKEEPGNKDDLKRHLLCVRLADGSIDWTASIPRKREETGFNSYITSHGYASSTPVVDDTGIYVFHGRSGVMAYDHKGKERWTAPCGDGYENFGSGASPIIYKEMVIVNADVESGSIIAFDKGDGKEVWRYTGDRASNAWCTPLIVRVNGADELVTFSARFELIGLDPLTGKRLWHCAYPSSMQCASVIAHEGVVYAIGDTPGATVAVRTGGRGDVTATHKLWTLNKGSVVTSPVLHNGHLFWAKEESTRFYCVDALSGKLVYEERPEPAVKGMYASPLLAGGRLYFVSQTQGTLVVDASPTFKLIAHNVIDTDDSAFNGSPVVTGDRLLLRSNKALYCIGTR